MSAPPGSDGPPPPAWWRSAVGDVSTSGVTHAARSIGGLGSSAPEIPTTTKLLLCGGVAGAFSKSCTAPLARITILRQLQSTGQVPGWIPGENQGILRALSKIVREEGVRALWKGNGVTVLHRLPYSSINFYAYENIMDWLEGEGAFAHTGPGVGKDEGGGEGKGKSNGDDESSNLNHNQNATKKIGLGWDVARRLLAGGSAGMIACTLTYPLDLVRTRLAAQTTTKHYSGLTNALVTIAKEEGIRGLYRGLAPTLAGVGPNLAINFAAYETFRRVASEKVGKDENGVQLIPPWAVSLVCGSSAAVVSATATYPLDLVRRRLQMVKTNRIGGARVTIVNTFAQVYAKEGFVGFYRGIVPEYAKVVPGVSITYATYELLKRSIGVDTGRL
jgi:solute carrier family 25 phosphate transporter 23/24/25/41|tara:strand:+ start:310 stop:1476 length:1167 start_codon:yes stop_codon:yes gene_type:complete